MKKMNNKGFTLIELLAVLVSVPTLIDDGYLTLDDAKDPQNEKSTICGYVIRDGNSFVFKEHSSYCRNIG